MYKLKNIGKYNIRIPRVRNSNIRTSKKTPWWQLKF